MCLPVTRSSGTWQRVGWCGVRPGDDWHPAVVLTDVVRTFRRVRRVVVRGSGSPRLARGVVVRRPMTVAIHSDWTGGRAPIGWRAVPVTRRRLVRAPGGTGVVGCVARVDVLQLAA